MSDSADKRNVATDALATLGTIIGPSEKRDAIHIAVEPVIAGETLRPGDHISVKDGVAVIADPGKGLGIADPFLLERVPKGARFWFLMYPRQVRSLRHVWSHPSFPDETSQPTEAPLFDAKVRAEARIRAIVAEIGGFTGYDEADPKPLTYEMLMGAADQWLASEGGDYLVQLGYDSWRDSFEAKKEEFWRLYEIVRGKPVPDELRGSFFSCSC